MLKPILLALACFAAASVSAYAQEPANPAQLGSAPLTQEDAERSNVVSYGISSSATFDDNAVGSGSSNITSSVQPQVGFTVTRSRMQSHFSYSPSYAFSTNLTSQSGTSQAAGGDLQYFLTKRLMASLRGSFVTTSNPIESVRANAELPQIGILERPADPFLGAQVHQTRDQFSSDLAYRITRYTSIGTGGTFSDSMYRTQREDGSPSSQAVRAQAWSAHAFLSHRFTPIYTLGLTYTAQNFSTKQSGASVLTHSPLGVVSVDLNPHVQVSVFAGPDFADVTNPVVGIAGRLPQERTISLSYGSTVQWQGQRNGLGANFIQRVGDSSLVGTTTGAVRARMVDFHAARQLTRRMTLNLFTDYVSNSALQQVLATPSFDSVTGGVTLTRPLTPSIAVSVSGFHQEILTPNTSTFGIATHNVVAVSLTYGFVKPIGR